MKDRINRAFLAHLVLLIMCCPAYSDSIDQSNQTGFSFLCEDLRPDCRRATVERTNESVFIENATTLTVDDILSAQVTVYEPINWKLDEKTSQILKFSSEPAVIISVHFFEDGVGKLSKVTSENIGRRLGLLINGDLILVRKILEHIPKTPLHLLFVDITEKEANDIVQRMNTAIKKYNN